MIKFCTFLIFLLLVVTTVMLVVTRNRFVDVNQSSESQGSGTALIGGDFILVNQDGKEISGKDFRGQVMLVFFGFTHCPDVCPTTVMTFKNALELLGDKVSSVAPIFITVDPQRDTSSVLKEYLANIDQRIIGLTGSEERIKQVLSAYKAYAAKSKIASDGEYGMDHSGFIYLMDKNGVYIQHFPYDASVQDIADAVLQLLE